MLQISASLGFMWPHLSHADAVRAAAAAGFDAVECHFPFAEDAAELRAACEAAAMPMLGINTPPGDLAAGDFGLAALPDRRDEALRAIDAAIGYAAAVGARNVHVMAGKPGEASPADAEACFVANLSHAADAAAAAGIGVLIEPINQRDVPGYFLSRLSHAVAILDAVDRPNLRMMFDCYHTQIMEGDLTRRIADVLGRIGHVQIASVPERAEPDRGEVAYERLLGALEAFGYTGFVGAEYRPAVTGPGGAEAGLGWLARYRAGSA